MLKNIVVGILLTSSLFAQLGLSNFFKYSTAYGSFSLNAPRYQDDRFAIVGGLSTGALEVERTERELKPDFQHHLVCARLVDFSMSQREALSLLVKVVSGTMVQNRTLMRALHSDLLKVGSI